jgi:Protein of unknown function (DUF2510)
VAADTSPAGWYADPNDPQLQRYWDGSDWTQNTAPGPAAGTAAGAAAVAQPQIIDPYNKMFNVAALNEQQRQAYMQNTLTEFPTWAVLVLSILTLGIFGTIYHGLKHSKLPLIKSDDFMAGKGIGFLFIPFFNLYWQFPFWLRLCDRINFQYRLRGAPDPVSKDLALWTIITGLAGYVIVFTFIAWPVLACISAAQIQSAANKLARNEVQPLSAQPQVSATQTGATAAGELPPSSESA